MRKTPRPVVPPDLKQRLELARLDTLALLRAIDRLHLGDQHADAPDLVAMFTLDADCAEALTVILEPPAFGIDWTAMARDTEDCLRSLPGQRERARSMFGPHAQDRLRSLERQIRDELNSDEAYNGMFDDEPTFR